MIIGLGCDVVNIERLNKSREFVERFMQRILGEHEFSEIKKITDSQSLICSLAKRYAAKEAFVKALGTGFRNGIYLRDIEVLHNDLGKPVLKVNGIAKTLLSVNGDNVSVHVSLSDDYPYAQAVVIIEK